MRNYIALLGWGLDAETTFITTDELVAGFSLERVSKNPAIFDEQKLRWMNGRYLRELATADLAARLEAKLGRGGLEPAATVAQEKMQTLADFWPLAGFLVEPQPTDDKAWEKVMDEDAGQRLAAVREELGALERFDHDSVEAALRGLVERLGVKAKEVFQPLRVAIAGTTISPGIFESVAALGREETLARVESALERLGAPR